MSNFKVKIAILLIGTFSLSGCCLFTNKPVINVPVEVKVVENKQTIIPKIPGPDASILFVGDLMFDRSIRQFAKRRGNDFIFEEIRPILQNNDLVVANLEGPITDNESLSVGTEAGEKGHFSFTFDKSLAGTLAKNMIKLVDIGNNHILNFKESGLVQTEKYLKEAGVDCFGNPKNEGKNRIIKEIDKIKVGFISYNQFGGNAEGSINGIKELRNKADVLVVYAHWGKEYEKTPSDNIKKLAYSFVDSGADLVIGSHPHVIQNAEEYKGKKIYYSLGNFIFDQYFSTETQKGLAVKVRINPDDKSLKFQEINLFMDKNGQTKQLLPN